MRSGNAAWGPHSAANQEAFNGVMGAVAAKVEAEIVPFIGGSDGPRRKLEINHKKVDDAFKLNFYEEKKAQYQPVHGRGLRWWPWANHSSSKEVSPGSSLPSTSRFRAAATKAVGVGIP